jgi:hypothetical protein
MEGTPMTDGRSKMLVAYHEVGHAMCATMTAGHDAVQKVTLIPRGQAKGLTWFIPGARGCGVGWDGVGLGLGVWGSCGLAAPTGGQQAGHELQTVVTVLCLAAYPGPPPLIP